MVDTGPRATGASRRPAQATVFGPRLSARMLALSVSAFVPGLFCCVTAGGNRTILAVGVCLVVYAVWRMSYLCVGRTRLVLDDRSVSWRVGGWGRTVPLSAITGVAPYGAAINLSWTYGLRLQWVDEHGNTDDAVLPDVFEATPEELATELLRVTLLSN